MNRRQVVRSAAAAGVLAGVGPLAAAGQLLKTPRDYTGPFYPRGPRNRTHDLIVGTPRADILQLAGRVLSPDGEPRAGVLVDIWHADPQGRYKHPRDRGQDRLMEEFLYWGEAVTDDSGAFGFRTYVPGSYAARPARHIHYKVWADEEELLTSQIYFAEFGGPGRQARSRDAAARQTASVKPAGAAEVNAEIDIVI